MPSGWISDTCHVHAPDPVGYRIRWRARQQRRWSVEEGRRRGYRDRAAALRALARRIGDGGCGRDWFRAEVVALYEMYDPHVCFELRR